MMLDLPERAAALLVPHHSRSGTPACCPAVMRNSSACRAPRVSRLSVIGYRLCSKVEVLLCVYLVLVQ